VVVSLDTTYTAANDALINITGATGTIATTSFIA
jgi:hypothetical protein